jgi:hypothetical protein
MAGAAAQGAASEPGARVHQLGSCTPVARATACAVARSRTRLWTVEAATRVILATAMASLFTKQRRVLLENLLRRFATSEHPQTRTGYVEQLSEILVSRQSANQAFVKLQLEHHQESTIVDR